MFNKKNKNSLPYQDYVGSKRLHNPPNLRDYPVKVFWQRNLCIAGVELVKSGNVLYYKQTQSD